MWAPPPSLRDRPLPVRSGRAASQAAIRMRPAADRYFSAVQSCRRKVQTGAANRSAFARRSPAPPGDRRNCRPRRSESCRSSPARFPASVSRPAACTPIPRSVRRPAAPVERNSSPPTRFERGCSSGIRNAGEIVYRGSQSRARRGMPHQHAGVEHVRAARQPIQQRQPPSGWRSPARPARRTCAADPPPKPRGSAGEPGPSPEMCARRAPPATRRRCIIQ